MACNFLDTSDDALPLADQVANYCLTLTSTGLITKLSTGILFVLKQDDFETFQSTVCSDFELIDEVGNTVEYEYQDLTVKILRIDENI